MTKFSIVDLLKGGRTQLGAVVLMRGQTFIETIEDQGGMVVIVFFRGTTTITRGKSGEQPSLHMTPKNGEVVWLTSPGTYCVTAKDHAVGVRVLRKGQND